MATGQPFSYKDDCIRRDPHLGYHEGAANATRKAVKAFIRTGFQVGVMLNPLVVTAMTREGRPSPGGLRISQTTNPVQITTTRVPTRTRS